MTTSRPVPNLFVVGAARCGTTTLHARLAEHSEVWMSPVKEPNFFSRVRPDPSMRHLVHAFDEERYRAMFAAAPDLPYVGEASPSYLWSTGAAARIREWSPQARIVISLRDPIERAHSHYLADVREGLQRLPFADAVREDLRTPDKSWGGNGHMYVDLGLYAAQVERYLSVFPSAQVLVLGYRELQEDLPATMHRIAEFLGVREDGFATLAEDAHNVAAAPRGRAAAWVIRQRRARQLAGRLVPRRLRGMVREQLMRPLDERPEVDPATRELLQRVLEPDVTRLESVLGRQVPGLRDGFV